MSFERRARLLAAAAAAFADLGYYRARVSDIVARAGLAQGSFYLSFRSKREAFLALVDQCIFIIDESICMQCGFCAEYCPFDAIKMGHRYELATPDPLKDLVRHKADLLVPEHYYASIHPTDYAAEEEARRQEAAARAAKAGASARE